MMSRLAAVFLALVAVHGCGMRLDDNPSVTPTIIRYLHDARTDLCFALIIGGNSAEVPCSVAVRKLAAEVML